MSYAPKHIADLRSAWVDAGGVDLGIVGDSSHPSGYHVGRDRIYSPTGQGSDDYSVQQPRDKAGLTNAASAFDFGHDDLGVLRSYSNWLVAYCQSGGVASEWVREVIYSPDGKVVQRWSGVDGLIHPGWPTATGNGDATHLTHTHLSLFRDAEAAKADLTPLVTTWATTPPDTSTEDPMACPIVVETLFGYGATVGGPSASLRPTIVRVSPTFGGAPIRTVGDVAEPWTGIVGWVQGDANPADADDTRWLEHVAGDGRREFVPHGDVASLVPASSGGPTLDSTISADGQTVTVSIKGA